MLFLFTSAAVIVFFVNNIITVNGLVTDSNNIRTDISKTITVNNNLLTEIERLSNLDNIKNTAVDKLGLRHSVQKPKKITIERSKLEDIVQ